MGEVFTATDARLDRVVAIKLVRSDRISERTRTLLLREAEALARLSHPNVVQVFDVGLEGGDVFIAMEFVDGQTLRAWNEGSHSRDEILDAFVSAGHGLQAAHAAGIIHRDFKPSNVLIGTDGLVRLSDFGVARVSTAQTGDVVGTPRYMAPEQRRGHSDARSDQYSFCLSLCEALHGRRVSEPPTRTRVDRVLAKGLAEAPGDRFGSMHGLLEAIARARRPRAGRFLTFVGVGAGALGVVALMQRAPTECPGARAVDEAWNPRRAEAVQAAFAKTDLGYAPDVAARVVARLDETAARWRTDAQVACTANQPRSCLQQQRSELDQLAAVLEQADADVVRNANKAILGLRRCEGVEDGPVAESAEHAAIRERLAALKVADLSGRVADGIAEATATTQRARALGDEVLLARALFRQGRLLERTGAFEQASSAFEESFHLAWGASAPALAAENATMLVTVLGIRQSRFDDASHWAHQGEAAVARTDDALLRAGLRTAYAGAQARSGRLLDARKDYREALALQRAALGDSHFVVAATLNNLAAVMAGGGEYAEAAQLLAQAVAIFEAELGPHHPSVAHAVANLAAAHRDAGHVEMAEASHRRALTLVEAASGPLHPATATAAANLGRVLLERGEVAEATALFNRSLRIRVEILGSEHPEVAHVRISLGEAHLAAGRLDAAEQAFVSATASITASQGPEDRRLAYAAAGSGNVALARNQRDRSIRLLSRALELLGPQGTPADRASIGAALRRAQALKRDPSDDRQADP